jgi:hypothetical protein
VCEEQLELHWMSSVTRFITVKIDASVNIVTGFSEPVNV